MTSSNCSELILRQDGRLLAQVKLDDTTGAVRQLAEAPVTSTRPISLELRSSSPSRFRREIRIGDELHLVVRPDQNQASSTIPPLREDYGELIVTYREIDPEDGDHVFDRCEICLEVEAPKETVALFERLIADLEHVHLGLAREVLGKTRKRAGHSYHAARFARPEEDLQLLETALHRLDGSLTRIQRQPVHAIARDVRRDRWRPGDRLASNATSDLLRDPDTVLVDRRPKRVGRTRLLRARPTLDIPEHRVLRAELEDLVRRTRRIASHCMRCVSTLQMERQRWGSTRDTEDSVFHNEFVPRIRRYELLAERSTLLTRAFEQLRRRTGYLDEAGPSRVGLRPTPLFLNGVGYRDAYSALLAVRRAAAPLVSGDEFRIHFRSLARLYEYWCFIQVVERLRHWFGEPTPHAEYEIVDEIYRPDLRPGQWFRFGLPDDHSVVVHYEPDIVPWTWNRAPLPRYRATLSTAPLRPDVLVELNAPDQAPIAMVLDAKSTTRFDRDSLWKPSDYRSRVVDPVSGTQPIRQVFFLHRDERSGTLENIPGYLRGNRMGRTASLIGAVACLPWAGRDLTQILRRFLRTFAPRLDVLDEEPPQLPREPG